MPRIGNKPLLLAPLGVAAALVLSGCADEEEAATLPTATAETVAPAPAPAPTATQPATPAKPQTTAAPKPEPAAPSSDPNACETGQAISRLKFKGIPCDEAAPVADAWDRAQNRCNTIDDPESPRGYNRTCTVEDYTCRAKRGVKSDARFVACAKGPAQVRFTWAPP